MLSKVWLMAGTQQDRNDSLHGEGPRCCSLEVPLIRWKHTVLGLVEINPLPQSVPSMSGKGTDMVEIFGRNSEYQC